MSHNKYAPKNNISVPHILCTSFVTRERNGWIQPGQMDAVVRWLIGAYNTGAYRFSWSKVNSIHPISAARNFGLNNHFLPCGADIWLILDNDIEPPQDLINAVLNMPEDCAIAVFPYWVWADMKPMLAAGEWSNGQMVTHDFATEDWHEIGAGGTGAMAIRRSVFDKVPSPPFKIIYDSTEGQKMSEDIYFTANAKEAGLRIFTHTGYICEHHRTVGLAEVNAGMVSILRKAFDIVRDRYGDQGITVPTLNEILSISIQGGVWVQDDTGTWRCPDCKQVWAKDAKAACVCEGKNETAEG